MKKLSEREKYEREIKKAMCSIKKLEKYYGIETLSHACSRYSNLCRERRKAVREKEELEQKLAELKGKLK